jgi:hypothetical protein
MSCVQPTAINQPTICIALDDQEITMTIAEFKQKFDKIVLISDEVYFTNNSGMIVGIPVDSEMGSIVYTQLDLATIQSLKNKTKIAIPLDMQGKYCVCWRDQILGSADTYEEADALVSSTYKNLCVTIVCPV